MGYVGCYDDLPSARILDVPMGRGSDHIQQCAVRCTGYNYFGMEVR